MIKISENINIKCGSDFTVVLTTDGKDKNGNPKKKEQLFYYGDLAGSLKKAAELLIVESNPETMNELKKSIILTYAAMNDLKDKIDDDFKIIKVSK